jgi:hypothetical protein
MTMREAAAPAASSFSREKANGEWRIANGQEVNGEVRAFDLSAIRYSPKS